MNSVCSLAGIMSAGFVLNCVRHLWRSNRKASTYGLCCTCTSEWTCRRGFGSRLNFLLCTCSLNCFLSRDCMYKDTCEVCPFSMCARSLSCNCICGVALRPGVIYGWCQHTANKGNKFTHSLLQWVCARVRMRVYPWVFTNMQLCHAAYNAQTTLRPHSFHQKYIDTHRNTQEQLYANSRIDLSLEYWLVSDTNQLTFDP